MKFIVVSRGEIERGIVVRTPYVVVSIADPGSRPVRLRRPSGFRDVLFVQFHDAEPSERAALPDEVVLMSEEQAKAIWDFVLRHRDQVETVVVHCEQGMSRSPAVAAALCSKLGTKSDRFFKHYQPNEYVYALMQRAFPEEGERAD